MDLSSGSDQKLTMVFTDLCDLVDLSVMNKSESELSDLRDVDGRQRLTCGVSARCDLRHHGGLWAPRLRAPSAALQADRTVGAAAGAGGRPPSDEGNFHRGVRSETPDQYKMCFL